MTAAQIVHLYTARTGDESPEIDTAVKWYLEAYIPARLEEASWAREYWKAVIEAAQIEENPKKERDAEKNLDAVNKAAEALDRERDDWKQNGQIFLL